MTQDSAQLRAIYVRWGTLSRGKWHVDTNPDSDRYFDHVTLCGVRPNGLPSVHLRAGTEPPKGTLCALCARKSA